MKKFLLLVLQVLILLNATDCQQHQTSNYVSNFNFDFEKTINDIPEQWINYGTDEYIVGLDSINAYNGKYAAFIEHMPDKDISFKAWALEIPGSYDGKKITLSGYIKTENVSDGHAGLWMRIDPEVAFDNMADRGIKGTTDWKQYKITLSLNPDITSKIVVGGLLTGKGKMWIDDLVVTIDGKDIRTLEPVQSVPDEFGAGSLISDIQSTPVNIKTLKDLGLIWGFLKYYHPVVATGEYNWDYELFRIIPRLMNEKENTKRDAILVEWINGLGPVPENTKTADINKENIKLMPDLEWIEDSRFSPELIAVLERVKNAERNGRNHYVGLAWSVNNPEFKNEIPYGNMKYPDMGYRLLALFRYWNMIQYYFPYKYLIEEDWKNILEEFIPRFIDARNETEYVLSVLELIGRIHDTHGNIWSYSDALENYKGKYYAAPILSFIEDKAVVTGFHKEDPGRETGLKIGDVILEIDGKKTEELVKERLKITPASNYPTQLRDIAPNLLRTNEQTINISYTSDGIRNSAKLTTYSTEEINPYRRQHAEKEAFEILSRNIGYLYPASLEKGEIGKLWKSIENTEGLIIDLRCYPSDFIVFSLGMKLVPKSTPFVKISKPSMTMPGLFSITEKLSVGKRNPDYYKGKIVILINEETQSQAEYTTMAFRVSPNATVVGSTTAGADGNVSPIVLPGGIRTAISGIGIYYPDGAETQRIGIVPDIGLKPTIKGVSEGRDELLEKALELIR